MFDDEEREILDEQLRARARRSAPSATRGARRRTASRSFQPLLDAWGGVTLVYRKKHAPTRPPTA